MTPLQSSTQTPRSQCDPAVQRTPTQAESTHVGTAAVWSHASPGGHPEEPDAHAHDGKHRPRWHAEPDGHVTSEHGSTQPNPRQIWPAGQRTSAVQVATHVFASLHASPGGQPKTEQSIGAQRHGLPNKCDSGGQPKSSSGMHATTHTLPKHPCLRGQASGTTPLQLKSFFASHASGAPGYVAGSWSSQSQGVPDHGQPHAAKPSPSSSAQEAPASHASAVATRGTANRSPPTRTQTGRNMRRNCGRVTHG